MPKKKIQKEKNELVEQIRTVSKAKAVDSNNVLVPTGITLLDLVLNGGYPLGTIVNIIGDSSSGKTYLTLETIVHNIKNPKGINKRIKKVRPYYDDAEGGFSFDTRMMYGVEVIPDEQLPSSTVEEMGTNLTDQIEALSEEEALIYVVDSMDGLSSEPERVRDEERQKAFRDGKDYDKGTYAMEKQKYLSQFFRLRASEIKHKNVLVIIISQVRCNITGYGEKWTRSGGKALDFYAHTHLWLQVVEKIKKKDRPVGVRVKAWTKKAKTDKPFRDCFLDLFFDYGIDDIGSNINYLYDLLTPQGKEGSKKAKVVWEDKEFNRLKLIQHIEENNLEEVLRQKVFEKWNEIEDSISTKNSRKPKW